jgi:ABC-2 type transport system ATP-binding protein
VRSEGGHVVLETDDLQRSLAALLGWADRHDVRLERLEARAASLESVFLSIAERQPEGALR